MAKWTIPPSGRLKLKGNPSHSGFGCFLKDESGKKVWALAGSNSISTNNEVKYWALVRGLQECIKRDQLSIDIEGDSHMY
ncbi:hypothetical protein SUGI_0402800 [Cryptomeria japonica]|nr:hypothetical protein SUGI_0402800 [Cryptomeria japonica]